MRYPTQFINKIENHEAVNNAWYEGEDGYWLNLNEGWGCDGMDEIHEHTQKEVLAKLKNVYRVALCPS